MSCRQEGLYCTTICLCCHCFLAESRKLLPAHAGTTQSGYIGVAAAHGASVHLGHACQCKAVPSWCSQVGSGSHGLEAISAAASERPGAAAASACLRSSSKRGTLRLPRRRCCSGSMTPTGPPLSAALACAGRCAVAMFTPSGWMQLRHTVLLESALLQSWSPTCSRTAAAPLLQWC